MPSTHGQRQPPYLSWLHMLLVCGALLWCGSAAAQAPAPANQQAQPTQPPTAQSPAPQAQGYPSVGRLWANGIWGDGEGRLWLLTGGAVLELRRGASQPTRHKTGLYAADDIAGTGSGIAATIAVLAGSEVSLKRGASAFKTLPSPGAKGVAIALTPDKRLLLATQQSGLRIYHSSRWTIHAYPKHFPKVYDLIDGGSDGHFLLAPGPRILHFHNDALRELELPNERGRTEPLQLHGWYQPSQKRLWLGWSGQRIYSMQLGNKIRFTKHSLDLFGSLYTIGGIDDGATLLLVVGAQSTIARYDGKQVSPIGSITFTEGVYVDRRERAAYFASRDGLRRIALPGAATIDPQTLVTPPPPPPAPATIAPPAPLPKAPPRLPESPAEDDDDSYAPDFVPIPQIGATLGPAFHFVPDAPDEVSFALDVFMGLRVMDLDELWGFIMRPELTYSYDSSEAWGGHRATAGYGLGYGGYAAGFVFMPRFVVGSQGSEIAYGMRYGLRADALLDLFNAEVAHQVLWPVGEPHHELRLNFGVDLAPIFAFILLDRLFNF